MIGRQLDLRDQIAAELILRPFSTNRVKKAMSSKATNTSPVNPQIDDAGYLKHFLTIEGLSKTQLITLLDTASVFIGADSNRRREQANWLIGHTVVNLFFEDSTRTRTTFEIAAKRLGAAVINLNPSRMSTRKGETYRHGADT